MKRSIAQLIAMLVLGALLLTGCSMNTQSPSSQEASGGESLAQINEDGSYNLPLVSEPVTITVATHDNYESSASYTSGLLPIFEELQNRTGITIEFEVYNSADYDEVMQTRLASGTDLPDLILVPGTDPVKYASSGLIIPLNDLIENYAPNIKALYQEVPAYQKPLIAPNGNQYTIATVMDSAPMNIPTLVVRKDWLDRVGLEIPKTIDDWTKTFEAFKTMDANGNGDPNDEIPFCGIEDPFYSLDFFMSAYDLDIMDRIAWENLGVTQGEDGKLTSDWYSPNAKEYLSQMNAWYEAGYFDKEMFTIDGDKWNAKILTDKVGVVGPYSLNAPQWSEQMQADVPGANWVPAPFPAGPYSDGYTRVGSGLLQGNTYAITKDCENPELVMQFLDYIYAHPEGSTLITWGIEGETYTVVDGQKQYTDAILKADNPGAEIWRRGMQPNLPYIQGVDMMEARIAQYPEYIATMNEIAGQTRPSNMYAMRSDEESATFASLRPDLRTYVAEMMPKFVTGEETVDNYDDFVQKLKDMGLDEFISLKQILYDRANS